MSTPGGYGRVALNGRRTTLNQRKHSFHPNGTLPGIQQDRGQVATVAASKIEQALHDAEAAVLQKLRPALPGIGANGGNGCKRSRGRASNDGNAIRSWDTRGTAPAKLDGFLDERTLHESPVGDEPLHPEEKRAPRKISRAAIEQFLERRRSSSQISAAPSPQKNKRGYNTVAGNSNEITLRHTPTDTASNRSNYIRARAQRARRAATLIQAAWRGHVLRRELAFQAQMVTRIQALFRGHSTRQMLTKAKKKPRRPKLGWWADYIKAIVLIQTTYRRHMARRLVDLHRHEHADLAARIIQQGWATYLARRAWLSDTTAVVEVPYMIKPNALAAAAYVHGTRVLSVKVHHAMETSNQEVHILCGSNISARRTEMVLNNMIGEKLEQLEVAKRPRQSFFGGMFTALKGSPGRRRASKRASKNTGQASQQPYVGTSQSYDHDEPGVTVTRGIPRGHSQPRQLNTAPRHQSDDTGPASPGAAVRVASTTSDILNFLGAAEVPSPVSEEPEPIAEEPEPGVPEAPSPSLIEGIGNMLAQVAVTPPRDVAGATETTTTAQEVNSQVAEAANAATKSVAAKARAEINTIAEAKTAKVKAAEVKALQQEYDAAKNVAAAKAAAETKPAEAKATQLPEAVQREYNAAKNGEAQPDGEAAKAAADEAETESTAASNPVSKGLLTLPADTSGSFQASHGTKTMVPPLKFRFRIHEIYSSPASAHLHTGAVGALTRECTDAEDATRKHKTGLMELALFQSDADQDKFFVMTAFNDAVDEGPKEVALVDLATRTATSKISTDFEVLVENGNPGATDMRLLPRSKYFTSAGCVASMVNLSCLSDATGQIGDKVAETLLQFRQICVQRETVIQCMVLLQVAETSRQYKLVVVYEDSAAAEEHTESMDRVRSALSLLTLSMSTTMLSRPVRASEPALLEAIPASEAAPSEVALESACSDDVRGTSAPRLPRLSMTEVEGTISDVLDVIPIETQEDPKAHTVAAEASNAARKSVTPDAAPADVTEMLGAAAQAVDVQDKSVKKIKHVGDGIMTRTSDFEVKSTVGVDNTPTTEQLAGSPEPPSVSFPSSNTAKRKAAGVPAETLLKRSKSGGIDGDDVRTRKLTPEFLARIRELKGQVHPFTDDSKIEFMTDIEGNLQYLQTLVENSDVLSWDDQCLDLAENAYFVHGGDTVDKGPGDIRVLRLLMDLKIKYPERVFLIIGNRDSNKVRFMSELEEKYWGSNKVPFLEKHTPYPQFIEEKGLDHGEVAALKWMLHESMGCRQTFEQRRTELSELQSIPVTIISDAVVLNSFKDMIDPKADNPLYLQHLHLGQMMVQIGDCLFTHGGIHAAGIGYVPRKPKCANLADWVRTLNGWMDEELDNFVANPYYTEDGHRSCEDMIEYTAPWFEGSEFNGKSMIYSDGFVGTDGFAPRYPDPEVIDLLEDAGVTRVLVGHRPQGDTPTTLRCPSGLLVIVADTSFSDPGADKAYNPSNFRGAAFSTVKVTKTDVTVDGVTAKNGCHRFRLNKKHIGDEPIPDYLVGRQLEDETWVKTVLTTGKAYCAGWEGWTATAIPRDIEDILSSNPHIPLSSTISPEVLASMATAAGTAAQDSPTMPGLKPKFDFPDPVVDLAVAETAAPPTAVEDTLASKAELKPEAASLKIAQVDGAAMDEWEAEPKPEVAVSAGPVAKPAVADDVAVVERAPTAADEILAEPVSSKPGDGDAAAMDEGGDDGDGEPETAAVSAGPVVKPAEPAVADDVAVIEPAPTAADEILAEPVAEHPSDGEGAAMDEGEDGDGELKPTGVPLVKPATPAATDDVAVEPVPTVAGEATLEPDSKAADAAAMDEGEDEHESVDVPAELAATESTAAELTQASADELPAEPTSMLNDAMDEPEPEPAAAATTNPAAVGDVAAELTPDPADETLEEPENAAATAEDTSGLTDGGGQDNAPASTDAGRPDELNDSILGPDDPEEEREFLAAEALAAAEYIEQGSC